MGPLVVALLAVLSAEPVALTGASATDTAPKAAASADAWRETARRFDAAVVAAAENAGKPLAPPIDDTRFLRRAWLDLAGVTPPEADVRAFATDRDEAASTAEREGLVERLLADERFGRNRARYWRDVVLSRRLEERALAVAPAMVDDLARWINEGRGWDAIAREFITAGGRSDEDGATAILVAQDGRTEEVAAEVSRVFLGVAIQCAQCHDHPWDGWRREQFHELAAFFPRAGVRPIKDTRPRAVRVVVNDRPDRPQQRRRPNANRRGAPEHYMADLARPEARGERMQPRFFLTGFERPVGTADSERRGALADELTRTEWFATALVNRVVTELFGEGFYASVDDLGPERNATAPAALAVLTEDFARSGYDLKRLYRVLLATDAYARESRPRGWPQRGWLNAQIATTLRADVRFNTLAATLGFESDDDPERPRRATPRRRFAATFGYDPSTPPDELSPTLPQTLLLMNSPFIENQLRPRRGGMIDRLLREHTTPQGGGVDHAAAVESLYLRALSRPPSDAQRRIALGHVADARDPRGAYADVIWALVNAAEFSHRR